MKALFAVAAILALTGPALAFDPTIAAVVNDLKPKQQLTATQVATLMRSSEVWCYKQDDVAYSCEWTDTYLDVTGNDIRVEVANAYGENNLYIVDQSRFEQDRYVCEYDYNWVPSVRMVRRDNDIPLTGRELDQWRVQFANNFGIDDPDCYDYLYVRSDSDIQTITLLQRTFSDFVKDEGSETLVTLHFNSEDAAGLSLAE